MPPYKANKSKAQERMMFVLEKQGKLAPGEAVGKARATKATYSSLPNRVKPKGKAKRSRNRKG